MLTMTDALIANEFHYGTCTRTVGPRGGVTIKREIWRRNGRTQTWKTRPNDYRVPVRYGMRTYGSIQSKHAANIHTVADCPLTS